MCARGGGSFTEAQSKSNIFLISRSAAAQTHLLPLAQGGFNMRYLRIPLFSCALPKVNVHSMLMLYTGDGCEV